MIPSTADASMKQRDDGDAKKRSSITLALVPLGVALAFGPLVLPRAAAPDVVPLPMVDSIALENRAAADRALAARVQTEPLPDDVRALGSAIREFHALESRDAPGPDLRTARGKVDATLQAALTAGGVDALVRLRASQLEGFMSEVRRFDETGVESEELGALGGSFIRRMRREGWVRDHAVLFGEAERRVVFKLMWNAFLSLDARAELTPTLDEQRALYGFYLSHPHASDAKREAIAAARRGAIEKKHCDAINQGERLAIEEWRMDRVNKLAAIDPSYPAAFARGVIHYRRGNYPAAAEAFRDWLRDHPSGPWSRRAEGHLRAALAMDASDVTR
jgi:hypothetical protein